MRSSLLPHAKPSVQTSSALCGPHLRFALSRKRGSVSTLPVAESSAGSQLIPQVIQFTNFANTIPLGCFLQLTAPAQQQPHARQEAKTSAKSTGVAAANKEMAELEVRANELQLKLALVVSS